MAFLGETSVKEILSMGRGSMSTFRVLGGLKVLKREREEKNGEIEGGFFKGTRWGGVRSLGVGMVKKRVMVVREA